MVRFTYIVINSIIGRTVVISVALEVKIAPFHARKPRH